MSNVYQQLARHLDRLPAGFPPTDSGVELRILKRLFTPEEARVATGLTMMPESAEAIADRLEMGVSEIADLLEQMSGKGLIFRMHRKGQTTFMAAQFVVGIWEYHVNQLDKDLIKDFNEYVPHLVKHQFTGQQTQQLRVIPVSKSIRAEMEVMPYEQAGDIIRQQSKIVVAPCICRKEHQMLGKGCSNPMEVCLIFGSGAYYYEENGLGRSIDQQEAMAILHQGQEAGLVLQPGNSQKPANICMCCGCCCQILTNLRQMDKPAAIVASNYYARVDQDACTGCGVCQTRCHMAAIQIEEIAQVDRHRCIGCGVCVPTCDYDAMHLVAKEPAEKATPPSNTFKTYLKMAKERGLIG
jgi:ferredoxin